jgi:hypothetical protein
MMSMCRARDEEIVGLSAFGAGVEFIGAPCSG